MATRLVRENENQRAALEAEVAAFRDLRNGKEPVSLFNTASLLLSGWNSYSLGRLPLGVTTLWNTAAVSESLVQGYPSNITTSLNASGTGAEVAQIATVSELGFNYDPEPEVTVDSLHQSHLHVMDLEIAR
jgi:hypothetical protein